MKTVDITKWVATVIQLFGYGLTGMGITPLNIYFFIVGSPSDITFFSSNNWDISGANSFGFKTVWINRQGVPWDALPGAPDLTAKSLLDALQVIDL